MRTPTAELGITVLHSTEHQNSIYMCWLYHNDCICFMIKNIFYPVNRKKNKTNFWHNAAFKYRIEAVEGMGFDT